jgi:hypothetical protein
MLTEAASLSGDAILLAEQDRPQDKERASGMRAASQQPEVQELRSKHSAP